MRNKEFEVARGLIAGRGPEPREHVFTGHAPAPASFREIDGGILARQYVAHRKFLETEALAQQFENTEGHPGGIRSKKLRDEPELHAELRRDAKPDGWLSSLARFLWRR